MNDSLQLRLGTSSRDGVGFEELADLVREMDVVVAEIWQLISSQPAPKLALIGSPRPGSIVIDFTINMNLISPVADREIVGLTLVDLIAVAGGIAGVGSLILDVAFAPWGRVSRLLGFSKPAALGSELSDRFAREALTRGGSISKLRSAARRTGCKTVKLNHRGQGDVELVVEVTPIEVAIANAKVVADEIGVRVDFDVLSDVVFIEMWLDTEHVRYSFEPDVIAGNVLVFVEWMRRMHPGLVSDLELVRKLEREWAEE